MELHTYYSKSGLLSVTWGKRIDSQSVRRHFELLTLNTTYARDLKVITSTNVEELGFALTRENMMVFRNWREEALEGYVSITTAFYSLKPVPAAYIDYFSEFFDSKKSLMRQFDSREAALAWLLPGAASEGHLANCL